MAAQQTQMPPFATPWGLDMVHDVVLLAGESPGHQRAPHLKVQA